MALWDRSNLSWNLKVLAAITQPGWGLRLRGDVGSYILDGGPGDDRLFAVPVPPEERTLDRMFAYARLRDLPGAVRMVLISSPTVGEWEAFPRYLEYAEKGIENIAETYGKVDGAARFFADITKQMQEAEATFAQAAKDSLLIKYRQYLMCKVEQRAYLRRGHEGVCFAFCMDWVSRKLHPHRLKASYLETKKQGGSSGSPDLSTERMTKKVTGRLMPLQHVYESIRGPESRVGDVLPQALNGYKGAHPEYYRTLKVESVVPRTFVVGRQDVPDSSQGEEVFREIVGRCGKTPVVLPSLVLLNESIAKHKADPKMKHWVEDWQRLAQKQGPVRQPAAERVYIIGLEGRRGAHAIALSIDSQKKQIFDPNHGEFQFGFATDVTFFAFCGDLWSYYRRDFNVDSWTLDELYFP